MCPFVSLYFSLKKIKVVVPGAFFLGPFFSSFPFSKTPKGTTRKTVSTTTPQKPFGPLVGKCLGWNRWDISFPPPHKKNTQIKHHGFFRVQPLSDGFFKRLTTPQNGMGKKGGGGKNKTPGQKFQKKFPVGALNLKQDLTKKKKKNSGVWVVFLEL